MANSGIRLRPLGDSPMSTPITLRPGDSRTIGRSPHADIKIDDASLSRLHARLSHTAEGTTSVEDLGSTNGVFVNGVQRTSATLANGDRLRLGSVEFLMEPAEAPRAAAPQQVDRTFIRVPIPEQPAAATPSAISALLATSRELMAFDDLQGLLDRVLDRLQPILKPDRSAILLIDPATGELQARAVRPKGAYKSVSDFASATAVREALSSRDVLVAYDARLDSRLQDAASVVLAGVRSAICVPLRGRSGAIGALYADQLVTSGGFTPEHVQFAAAFAAHAAAALETAQLYDDRERHFRATLEAFAKAIDARDHYTAGHSERVTAYTLALARTAGIDGDELEIIRRAGMLHDIGKVGVPDHVLLKPGPLDVPERAVMESHVTIGYSMLEALPFLQESLPAIRGHHERWDGRGYPDRLAGEQIPLHARLMSVGDSFDAMTSARPYRDALPVDEAARRLRSGSGTQFAPEAIEAFDAIVEEIRDIRTEMNQTRPVTAPATD
jgi:putative nucleotidyltransferase with HDIG domain